MGNQGSEPFWPETEQQKQTLERVANAALTEIGMGAIARIDVLPDGMPVLRVADHDAFQRFRSAEHYVDRAVEVGWQAASHNDGQEAAR